MKERKRMIKVTMAAPFDANGRYKGGICSLVNAFADREDLLSRFGVELVKFETCRVKREQDKESALNLKNIDNFLKIYRDLPSEIKREKTDCLYYHSSVRFALLKDLLAIRHAKKKTGIKTVLHIHFADYEKIMTGIALLDKLILRILRKYVDKIVFLSRNTMEQFVSHGISSEKCSIIYNFSTMECDKALVEERMENTSENTQFLFVGSIDRRKGIFDVLECMLDLEKDFTFHVCGGFNSVECEEKFAQYQEKLGSKLVFHGYVGGEEKKQLFLKSDVLLLPSYGEGLPVVILEAFAAASAVITTNVGAIPEIVNENSGVVIQAGNKNELEIALSKYVNGDKARLLQQQMYNYKLSAEYTIDAFVEKMSGVCHEFDG